MYNIVYSTIYRPGCFRTVRGRSEGRWQENRLLYSKYLTLQYILMRSRNRERDLAYVAWKGGAWGIGRRKGCFQINSRILHNVAERSFVACFLKLRLFPPVASTNVLLSGLPWAQHNYQNLPFLESPFRVRLELAGDKQSSNEKGKYACESGPRE